MDYVMRTLEEQELVLIQVIGEAKKMSTLIQKHIRINLIRGVRSDFKYCLDFREKNV